MEINLNFSLNKRFIFDKDSVRNSRLGSKGGVYVAYNSIGKVLYVGKTKNLENRFKGHRKDSEFYPYVESLVLFEVTDEFKKEIAETYLINELKPLYNVNKTYFKQVDYSLRIDELDEITDALESELIYLYMDRDRIIREIDYSDTNDTEYLLYQEDLAEYQTLISEAEENLEEAREERRSLSVRLSV